MADAFIVDTNVLLEAANTYYAFNRVPGFWDWMAQQTGAGSIRTVSLVQDELDYPPELVDWVEEQTVAGLLIDVSNPDIQAAYQDLVNWVVQQDFGPEHVAKFLDKADPWVIAAAAVEGHTVATQEKLVGPGTKKIKIPNVCEARSVECCNTFEMLESLDATF